MAVYLSPGVYYREVDLSLYVPALSSTSVGMVGVASKGPINEPTFISDAVQFTSIFGEPVVTTDANGVSTPESYSAYAAIQYLTQGRQLYFNRVAATDANGEYTSNKSYTTIYEDAKAATVMGTVRGTTTLTTTTNTFAFVFDTDFNVSVSIALPTGITSQVYTISQIAAALNSDSSFARWAKATVNVEPLPSNAAKNGVLLVTLTQLGSNHTVAMGVGNGNTAAFGTPTITPGTGSIFSAPQLFSVPLTFPYTIPAAAGDLELTIAYNIASRVGEKAIIGANEESVTLSNSGIFDDKVIGQSMVIGAVSTVISSLSTDKRTAYFAAPAAAPVAEGGEYDFSYACIVTFVLIPDASAGEIFANAADVAYYFNNLVSNTPAASFRTHFTATAVGNRIVFVPISHAGALTDITPTVTASEALDYGEELFGATPSIIEGTTPVAVLGVVAKSDGTWGNKVSVSIDNVSDATRTFDLSVYYKGNLVERYTKCVRYPSNLGYDPRGVVISNPKYIETITSGSSYVTITDLQKDVTSYFATLPLRTPPGTTVPLVGGSNGAPASYDVAPFIGTVDGTTKTGLQAFASAEDLDINLLMVPGIYDAAVLNEVTTICVNRADCFGILDCPRDFENNKSLTPQQVVDWHNGQGVYSDHAAFNSSYAALYWPWLQIYDAVNGVKVWCPPSGFMAGVYAFSDSTTEVWFAPAGLNRGHLTQPIKAEYSPSLGERDLMYGNGNAVNPIATFRQDGINVWGQRTLQRLPTALDRINVRRTLLYLEKVLSTAVRGLLFDPNDQGTWVRLRRLVTPTLESLKTRRGLQNYKVVCDASVNTPDVVEQNMMRAYIYVTPMKTVETIQLNFVITAQGSSFSEAIF